MHERIEKTKQSALLPGQKLEITPGEHRGHRVVVNVQEGDLILLLPENEEHLRKNRMKNFPYTLHWTERAVRRNAYRVKQLDEFSHEVPPSRLCHLSRVKYQMCNAIEKFQCSFARDSLTFLSTYRGLDVQVRRCSIRVVAFRRKHERSYTRFQRLFR